MPHDEILRRQELRRPPTSTHTSSVAGSLMDIDELFRTLIIFDLISNIHG